MSTAVVSAASRRYGWHLLNLLGSLAENSPIFDRVVVYDLGLSATHRRLLPDDVEVRTIPPFVEHWAEGFTWKPWIWTHLDAELIVYLDAGITVLRPLNGLVDAIRRTGYFLVSQERSLSEIVPTDYYEMVGLSPTAGTRDYVAAGILGFDKQSAFYDQVIVPTYEDCVRGLNLGVSAQDVATSIRGDDRRSSLPIHDCWSFRHDQTILNVHLAKRMPAAEIGDLARFAAWRSPTEHPQQVIWNHRRGGDLRYLRPPYRQLIGTRVRLTRFLADRLGLAALRTKLRRLLSS